MPGLPLRYDPLAIVVVTRQERHDMPVFSVPELRRLLADESRYRQGRIRKETLEAIRDAGGDKVAAARALGVHWTTIYNRLAANPVEDPWWLMTLLGIYIGARPSEIQYMEWGWVRWDEDAIHIPPNAPGRGAWVDSKKHNGQRPATFSFLGITHYVGTSRSGRFVVGRTTDAKRMRKKLKELSLKIGLLRQAGGKEMLRFTQQHLRGHINYYGVSGNARKVAAYVWLAGKALFKWLNRRSQRKSLTWRKWYDLIDNGLLPRPRIVHNLYPARPG
jgi:hypothetical protein